MKKNFFIFLLLSLSFIWTSCSNLNQAKESSIIINLPQPETRAAVPENVSYYRISVKCDSPEYEENQTASKTSSTVEFENLSAGTYTVYVAACDSSNSVVSEGSATAEVRGGQNTEVSIQLKVPATEVYLLGDINLVAFYASNPEELYYMNGNLPAEIPYKNDVLVFAAYGAQTSTCTWTLNGTVLENNYYVFESNPYCDDYFYLSSEFKNILTVGIIEGTSVKTASLIWSFTGTGLPLE